MGAKTSNMTADEKVSVKVQVPLKDKFMLTLDEANAYFSIGLTRLRELTNDKSCGYVVYNGKKRLIIRDMFEKFLRETNNLRV